MSAAVQPSAAVAGNHVELGKVEYVKVGKELKRYQVVITVETMTKRQLREAKTEAQAKRDTLATRIDTINAALAEFGSDPE